MGYSIRIPIFVLRLLALSATVAATVVMITSGDTADVLKFEPKYTNSPTFKKWNRVLGTIDFTPFSLLFFPSKSKCGHMILVLDLIIALLLDSSISACLAIGQVGKKGNSHAGWLPIFGQVPKFCDHITGAMVAGFVGAICEKLKLKMNPRHEIRYPLRDVFDLSQDTVDFSKYERTLDLN